MVANETADYRQIFLNDLPLMDVRAPVEFNQGAFPGAVNLPLMNDEEREAVGICYKKKGSQAALALGHSLVNGDLRRQRLEQWRQFCRDNPGGYLYCFRGGMRSHIVQQWLSESGIDYPLIVGGYKALRNYLIQVNQSVAAMPMHVIAGNTGCGKTILINELEQGIDLEGAARHRGSSFGKTLSGQTGQIDFENRLAITLLKKQHAGIDRWAIEDEGKIIGSNHVPLEIYQTMSQSPLVVIDDPFEVRLSRLQTEYIENMHAGFTDLYSEEIGWEKFAGYLKQGIYAIRKRLGFERYQQLATAMDNALQQQRTGLGITGHLAWLTPLLVEYYDPMYTYQLEKKADRIVFRGDYAQVKAFLNQQLTMNSDR